MNDIAGEHEVYRIFTQKSEELDKVAIHRNSIVGRLIHHPHIKRFDVTDLAVGDWNFQWVATMGHENHGVLILKPTNRRTKQLVVVGRAMYLITNFGVEPEVAMGLVQASWGVRHASNDDVLGLIVDSLTPEAWDGYEDQPREWVKARLERTDSGWDRMRSLHLNKIGSAYDVVRHYHEIRGDKRKAPPFPEKLLRLAIAGEI